MSVRTQARARKVFNNGAEACARTIFFIANANLLNMRACARTHTYTCVRDSVRTQARKGLQLRCKGRCAEARARACARAHIFYFL